MKAIKLQAYISSNRILNLQLPQEVIEGPAEVIILMDDSAQAVLQTQPEMPALDLSQLQGLPDVPSSLTKESTPPTTVKSPPQLLTLQKTASLAKSLLSMNWSPPVAPPLPRKPPPPRIRARKNKKSRMEGRRQEARGSPSSSLLLSSSPCAQHPFFFHPLPARSAPSSFILSSLPFAIQFT